MHPTEDREPELRRLRIALASARLQRDELARELDSLRQHEPTPGPGQAQLPLGWS